MSDVLIKVENASKKFCRSLKRAMWYGVRDITHEVLGRTNMHQTLRHQEFWAVNDISFELRRGECLGLIGGNGAGKTTLLRMLNGLIKPDGGRITMRGRVGALIALGAGFNPILTGRENIYVNGSVLGLTRHEIDQKINEIIDFADITDFIDSPVQSYSSGMQVRLGFAVATAMKPDILLLDEVLAVGDAAFRAKCYTRIANITDKAAVIFVSHNMEQVIRICNKALLLERGQSAGTDNVSLATERYLQVGSDDGNQGSFMKTLEPIVEAKAFFPQAEIPHGGLLQYELSFESLSTIKGAHTRIIFYDNTGQMAAEWDSNSDKIPMNVNAGKHDYKFELGPILLKPGVYRLGLGISDHTGIRPLFWSYMKQQLSIKGNSRGTAPYQIHGRQLENAVRINN